MPLHLFYLVRRYHLAIFSLVFALIIALHPSPALADPHAVFYTDRAQEQLFYNFLAALNQADYVEPGIPGSPYSRVKLVEDRAQQALLQSSINGAPSPIPYITPNPVENATRTNLPSVVTRNITLEGNDLWTAYLYQQFALETDIRRTLSELSRLYCENSLGRAGCSNEPGPGQNQSTVFPADISQYSQQPNLSLVANLSSGDPGEKAFQHKLTDTLDPDLPADALHPVNVTEPGVPEGVKFPRPNSPEMAALRGINQNNQDALNIIDRVTSSIIGAQYSTGINPNTFSKIAFTNNGEEIQIANNATFDDYINTIGDISSLLPGSLEVAAQGLQQGQKFQENRAQTPSLGQYTLTKEPSGGVKGTIQVPSSAIAAKIDAGANLLANQVIGEKIAGSTEIRNPGNNPGIIEPSGSVAGITTADLVSSSGSQNQGQVLGYTDISNDVQNLYNQYYVDPLQKNPNNPTTGIVPSFEEVGNLQFLEALGIKVPHITAQQDACGFCTQLTSIINNSTVTDTMIIIYPDMYCYFFPTTAYCTSQKNQFVATPAPAL